MALANVWHLRKVAEASAKPCDVCYKPATGVLITPDNKDHFYICQGHLKDRGFASPIVDEADAAAKKKKEELDREIELVKQEYEEKMKNKKPKKDKEGESAKDADKDKTKAEREPTNDEVAKAEQDRDDKIKAITSKTSPTAVTDDTPRIYALQKVFFQKRLDRLRNAEIARRNRERLKSPNLFPSVPTGNPG